MRFFTSYLRRRPFSLAPPAVVLFVFLLFTVVYVSAFLLGCTSVTSCPPRRAGPAEGPRCDPCEPPTAPARDEARASAPGPGTGTGTGPGTGPGPFSGPGPGSAGPRGGDGGEDGGEMGAVAAYVAALRAERTALLVELRRAGDAGDACAQRSRVLIGAVARALSAAICAQSARRFSVVFDAGSTGSRVHVYRYRLSPPAASSFSAPPPPLLSRMRLEHELFEENHEPLSGFADPAAAAASLRPLLESAKAAIPKALHDCTRIELKATAGLRQIGAERAGAVLREVRKLFAEEPFQMNDPTDAVRILEGREEGPLAWMTVNFLRKSLASSSKPAATTIDLGGGSAQLVMLPKNPALMAAHHDLTHTFKLNGNTLLLYQHSYEGNGLHAAKRKVLQAVATHKQDRNTNDAAVADAFPCFPRGYVHEESAVTNVRNGGTLPSLDACRALFLRYAVRTREPCGGATCSFNGVFQPNVQTAFDGPVYAFSFFFDLLKPYMAGGEEITVQDIRDIAQRVCNEMKTADEIAQKAATTPKKSKLLPEMECFELSYLFTLVHDGFGFPLTQVLRIAKKIDGFETSWSLGASLVGFDDE